MRLIWRSARVGLGLSLLAILALGPLSDRDAAAPLHITSDTPADDLVRVFARDVRAGVVYADTLPPSRDVATLMAGVAARAGESVLTVPAAPPALSASPPVAPVAMRRSALEVTLHGDPESDVRVTIDGASGTSDTVSLHIGASGTATAAVAIEPSRGGAGWWTVSAAGRTVTTHAWVQPESAVRVLILTGAPGWESRYLARALEAGGARVSVHQALGRDQTIVSSGAALPGRMADLEAWDVVALVGPLEAAPAALLLRWVTERGGGLLLVGPHAGLAPSPAPAALAPWTTVSPTTSGPADALQWSGPAEIVPLPRTDLTASLAIVPARGTPVTWSGVSVEEAEAIYATADWVGRGRIFSSGIETWPWVMEAGLVDEHRRYWESVVEWLAGGLTADVSLAGGVGRPGVAWQGRLDRVDAPSRQVRLVPTGAGGHSLGPDHTGEIGTSLGLVVVDGSERGSWTEAALEIGGAGAEVRATSIASAASPPGPLSNSGTLRWLLFLALGSLAVAAWATRRIAGHA